MANEVAFSDIGTKLYHKSTTYTELFGVRAVPATGAAGGKIEVTEMNSSRKQYVADRVDSPDQDFTYNRTAEKYAAALALCDGAEHEFIVVYSDGTGTYIKGTVQTWKNEFSTGSAQEATLHIVASEITDKTAEEVAALIPSLSV